MVNFFKLRGLFVPTTTLQTVVPCEWIDVNEHMNATRYGLVIYDAHYNFTQQIGLGDDYVAQYDCGKVVVESHMVYEREIVLGDELEVVSWLLAVDAKRMHFFHELYNRSKGCRAATSEQVDVHVDLRARRSAPLPEALRGSLLERVRQDIKAGLPDGVGRQIRPPTTTGLDVDGG